MYAVPLQTASSELAQFAGANVDVIPYAVVWLWTWVPLSLGILTVVAAVAVGLGFRDWASAGDFALIGAAGIVIGGLSYFSFWRDRDSN